MLVTWLGPTRRRSGLLMVWVWWQCFALMGKSALSVGFVLWWWLFWAAKIDSQTGHHHDGWQVLVGAWGKETSAGMCVE